MIRRFCDIAVVVMSFTLTVWLAPQAGSQTEKPKPTQETQTKAEEVLKKQPEVKKQTKAQRDQALGAQVGAQAPTPAQQVSQKALKLAEAGDVQAAQRELAQAQSACAAEAEGSSCRGTLTSTLAYLNQRQSALLPIGSEAQEQLLTAAAEQ